MRQWREDEFAKRRHVDPRHWRRIADQFLLTSFGEQKAKLVATDALWFYLKPRGAFEIGGGDPELAGIFARGSEVGGRIVINNSGMNFFCRGGDPGKKKKKEEAPKKRGFYK